MTTKPQDLLIGAHTSTAGGLENALYEGQKIGCTTVQIFTSNQKQWKPRQLTDEIISNWNEALQKTGIKKVMSHDSYLINLGAPNEEVLQKSREAFRFEIERCQQLDLAYLNFHPGAALCPDPQLCLDKICESLLDYQKMFANSSLRLLLETTAGQGSAVGWKFEHLAYIIGKVEKKIPIGVCIDTCHIFVAGYDCRTPEAWDRTLKEFDKVVGLKHLYAFHINDSMKDLGSRVDRHADLGKGMIGGECFKFLMTDKRTRDLPKYLETPDGPEVWVEEIKMLRNYAKG